MPSKDTNKTISKVTFLKIFCSILCDLEFGLNLISGGSTIDELSLSIVRVTSFGR